jgi:alpha-beta hydrolase superfamily lysophospholipase
MIESIFTRDKPGTSDPRVAEALAKAEMPNGDSVPTGTYLDMTANLPLVDPAKVLAPVLIIRGEYDGISTEEDLLDFFTKLPTADKQYAVIPGAAHAVTLSLARAGLWHVMHEFLTMPKNVQS